MPITLYFIHVYNTVNINERLWEALIHQLILDFVAKATQSGEFVKTKLKINKRRSILLLLNAGY